MQNAIERGYLQKKPDTLNYAVYSINAESIPIFLKTLKIGYFRLFWNTDFQSWILGTYRSLNSTISNNRISHTRFQSFTNKLSLNYILQDDVTNKGYTVKNSFSFKIAKSISYIYANTSYYLISFSFFFIFSAFLLSLKVKNYLVSCLLLSISAPFCLNFFVLALVETVRYPTMYSSYFLQSYNTILISSYFALYFSVYTMLYRMKCRK